MPFSAIVLELPRLPYHRVWPTVVEILQISLSVAKPLSLRAVYLEGVAKGGVTKNACYGT